MIDKLTDDDLSGTKRIRGGTEHALHISKAEQALMRKLNEVIDKVNRL